MKFEEVGSGHKFVKGGRLVIPADTWNPQEVPDPSRKQKAGIRKNKKSKDIVVFPLVPQRPAKETSSKRHANDKWDEKIPLYPFSSQSLSVAG